MEDFYELWRRQLLKDLIDKRGRIMSSLDRLENMGSTYYDSHVAYAKLIKDICEVIGNAPKNIGEFREIRDYGELLHVEED